MKFRLSLPVILAFALIAAFTSVSLSYAQNGEQWQEKRLDRLTERLKLSDAQRDQAKEIFSSHSTEFKDAMQNMHAAFKELDMAKSDDEVLAAGKNLKQAQDQLETLRSAVHQQILTILTDEQKAQAKTFFEKGPGMMLGRGGMMKGQGRGMRRNAN